MTDRLLLVGTKHKPPRYLRSIEPVNNTPVTTHCKDQALPLTWETAETIRFNLTARGYRVTMAYQS